jgi:hypothetical protein
MRFIQSGNHIECIRDSGGGEQLVSSFDASLDALPPHIEGALSSAELTELKAWLKDYRHIHETHTDELIFETVCEMIEKVCDQIESHEMTPVEHIEKLEMSAIRLLLAIKSSQNEVDEGYTSLNDKLKNMGQKDKLKVLLGKLSDDL